jgi:hypothetical protein
MLKVKLYFFTSFLVEVVRFFVTYDLARNKTGSVKDGMTELYKNDKQKTCIQLNKIKENQNVSRTCYFKILEGI